MSRAYDFIPREELERFADGNVRDKRGAEAEDYLKYWLKVLRPTGYASHDDSWGELEKLFAIFFPQAILARRICRQVFGIDDMRDVSPKIIERVVDEIGKTLERCQHCDRDMPGVYKHLMDGQYIECPYCDGTAFTEKKGAS